MKTINDLYRIYFNHNISPSQAPVLWYEFNKACEKVCPNLKLEVPLYVEICTKYIRANE